MGMTVVTRADRPAVVHVTRQAAGGGRGHEGFFAMPPFGIELAYRLLARRVV